MVIPSLGQTAVPLLLQYLHWDKQQHQKSLAAAITGLKMSSWENLSPGVFSHNRPAFVATTKGTKLFPTSMASTVLYWHTKPDGNQSLQQCFTGTQIQMGTNYFNSALLVHKSRWEPITSTVLYWYTKPDGNQSLQQCFTGTQIQMGTCLLYTSDAADES